MNIIVGCILCSDMLDSQDTVSVLILDNFCCCLKEINSLPLCSDVLGSQDMVSVLILDNFSFCSQEINPVSFQVSHKS